MIWWRADPNPRPFEPHCRNPLRHLATSFQMDFPQNFSIEPGLFLVSIDAERDGEFFSRRNLVLKMLRWSGISKKPKMPIFPTHFCNISSYPNLIKTSGKRVFPWLLHFKKKIIKNYPREGVETAKLSLLMTRPNNINSKEFHIHIDSAFERFHSQKKSSSTFPNTIFSWNERNECAAD